MNRDIPTAVGNLLRIVGKIVVHCGCGFGRTDPVKADSRFRFGTLRGRGFGDLGRIIKTGRLVRRRRPCALPRPVKGAHLVFVFVLWTRAGSRGDRSRELGRAGKNGLAEHLAAHVGIDTLSVAALHAPR